MLDSPASVQFVSPADPVTSQFGGTDASGRLTDNQLIARVQALCVGRRQLTAELVVNLADIEARNLHLRLACASLFDFCHRRLAMSEGTANRHMTAARLVRRFPDLRMLIEQGRIHLSGLVLLRPHLTKENFALVMAGAAGKSVAQIAEYVAAIDPKPDVPAKMTKLPTPEKSGVLPASDAGRALLAGMCERREAAASAQTDDDAKWRRSEASVEPAQGPPKRNRMNPLSAGRYKLQMTIDSELRDMIDRARDLMSHRNPTRDLVAVTRAAFEALIANLEKERLGKGARPRKRRPRSGAKADSIPLAVRGEVFARDGEQCTYCDEHGNRCPSRYKLELDHVIPRALGGGMEPENLRVRCRAHNVFYAEECFGKYVPVRHHFRHVPHRSSAVLEVGEGTRDSARTPAECPPRG